MAQPPLPTLAQVFEIKGTEEKGYVLNRVLLKDIVNEAVSKQRSMEMEVDEWTPFAEGIAAWAQSSSVRTNWSAASAHSIAKFIISGCLNNVDEFIHFASSFKEEFIAISSKLKALQKKELENMIDAHRLARAKLTDLNMGASRDDPEFLHCPPGQKSPSDLGKANSTPEGAGFMVVNEYDPSPTKNLHPLFLPSGDITDEIRRIGRVLQANSHARGLLPLGEKQAVQPRYNKFAKEIGFTAQTGAVKYSVFGSPSAGTSEGEMDGSFSMVSPLPNGEKWALAVWENTGEEASTFSAIRQAGLAYGFGIATFLVGIGMPVNEVFVPVVVYTGIQIQFGAVFVLQPTYPVFTLLSIPIDLSRELCSLQAARYIDRIIQHCKQTESKVNALLRNRVDPLPKDALSTMGMSLDKKRYFFKDIIEPTKGFELVGEVGSAEVGSYHMIRVLNHLNANLDESIKRSICFPICYCEHLKTQPLLLVFENLCHQDLEGGPYSVGLPPNKMLWPMWIERVQVVIKSIHKAGVVHVDLYPSNIMWRLTSNTSDIEIKLIDFDAAHITGQRWEESVRCILDGIVQQRSDLGWSMFEEANAEWDLQYLKVLRCLVETCATEDANNRNDIYDDLSSGEVDKINASFRRAANSIDIRNFGD